MDTKATIQGHNFRLSHSIHHIGTRYDLYTPNLTLMHKQALYILLQQNFSDIKL